MAKASPKHTRADRVEALRRLGRLNYSSESHTAQWVEQGFVDRLGVFGVPDDWSVEDALADAIAELRLNTAAPIPLLLWCPMCGARHIDEGENAVREHRTHACQACGVLFAPSVLPTVGVQFLPGCKNEVSGG